MKDELKRVSAMLAAFLFILHPSSFILSRDAPFFEPKEGYYGAKGSRVTAEWSLERSEVREDESLLATLVIRGAGNPKEIARPDLRSLSKFTSRFQIEDVPGPPVAAGATEVSFAYWLRPRNRDVDGIPSLDFFYLNPAIQVGNPYMNARVKGVPIRVTAAPPKAKPPAIPLEAPEQLFQIATGREVLRREAFAPGVWGWVAAFVAGPVLGGLWFLAWRRVYPDAARLARLRRTRAIRRATDTIRRAGRAADPPAVIAVAILGYLQTRFPVPPGAETPPEVRESLAAAGLPPDAADDVESFLRRCDEARFAPSTDAGLSLAPDAERLIARLEAVE